MSTTINSILTDVDDDDDDDYKSLMRLSSDVYYIATPSVLTLMRSCDILLMSFLLRCREHERVPAQKNSPYIFYDIYY
jgi:hypothetical protein